MDTFLQSAVGLVTSLTVTLAVQVRVFPLASVAVKVTTLMPKLAQVKVDGVRVKLKLQLSELPLFTAVGGTVIEPLAPRFAVTFLHNAVGKIKS